jgi:hypothetical protein
MLRGVEYIYNRTAMVTKLKGSQVLFTLSALPSYELPKRVVDVQIVDGRILVWGECNDFTPTKLQLHTDGLPVCAYPTKSLE